MYFSVLILLFYLNPLIETQTCSPDGTVGFNFTSCKTYQVCASSIPYRYNCPGSSVFDQRALKCKTNFTCPDTEICKADGYYPDPNYPNSSYYIKCTMYPHQFAVTYLDCGSNKTYVGSLTQPAINVTCVNGGEVPEIPPLYCVEEGSFHIYHTNCTVYKVCQSSNNTLVQHLYKCPGSSRFDPRKKLCALDYICLESNCTRLGFRGLDLNEPSRMFYYQCVKDTIGALVPLYLQCGVGLKFNETRKACV